MLISPLLRPFVAILLGALVLLPLAASATTVSDFIASLSPGERQAFTQWHAAQAHFERRLDTYWHEVERKRMARRSKRANGHLYMANEYVLRYPPEYRGPELSKDIERRWTQFLAASERAEPKRQSRRSRGSTTS